MQKSMLGIFIYFMTENIIQFDGKSLSGLTPNTGPESLYFAIGTIKTLYFSGVSPILSPIFWWR